MKMKNECDKIRNLILISEYDRDYSENERLILNHIGKCGECKALYEKVKQADLVINIMKKPPENFECEEDIVKGVFRSLENRSRSGRMDLIDFITGFVAGRKVRISLGFVLALIAAAFLFQNYNDASKISALEKKFDSRWTGNINAASVLREESDLLGSLYKIYKFINGETDYLDINKSWILLRRDRFIPLLKTLGRLEENELKNILESNPSLPLDKDRVFNYRINRDEIELLKNYLQLLEDELSGRGIK